MMEYWVLGEWIIGLLAKTLLTGKLINGNFLLKSTFHYSSIPLFQMRGRNPCLNKPL
jgi:hypothetical protein